MCGIAGVWGGVEPDVINAMVAALHHRGPDDRGVYHDATTALGATRLAIIDVSPAGHQPMANADGSVLIVYNGELYNFRSERQQLEAQGHVFTSASDTEVVLRMYEHYGDGFLTRLRGMFALAVYDRRRGPGRERLLLARDHFGIKPLLFAQAGGRLVFASEMKALLASRLVSPEIDLVALRLLLTYGSVTQPRTMLRGVNMLLPGHRMIVENGRETIERYWSMGTDRRTELRALPYAEQVQVVAAELAESVRLQLVADVPVGAFLSGGVDSSFLVGLMAQSAGHRIKTFSVGFDAEGSAIDESDEAQRTAAFLGTDHTTVRVRGTDVRDRIEHIVAGLDQPSVDGVNAYFVSLAARQSVTVAISGTGGDEFFAGYPWYMNMALWEHQQRATPAKSTARSLLAAAARQPMFDARALDPSARGHWRIAAARSQGDFLTEYANQYRIYGTTGAARVLAPDVRRAAEAGRSPHYDLHPIDELAHGSAIERVTGLCQRGYTTNQLLRDIDAVSMSHSLEVRVPFIDPVIADIALSLPDSTKVGDIRKRDVAAGATYRATGVKRILIDAAKPLLPPDFDNQPKRGFQMPFDSWLQGPMADVLGDTLSESRIRGRGLLDWSEVATIHSDFRAGRRSWVEPWLLMMLELWCRDAMDASSPRGGV